MQNKCYQVILSTAIVNVYDRNDKPHKCRVLLDSGSQSNFITQEFSKKLNLVPRQVSVSITEINKAQVNSNYTVNVRISSVHTSFSQDIESHSRHHHREFASNLYQRRPFQGFKQHKVGRSSVSRSKQDRHAHRGGDILASNMRGTWIVAGRTYNNGPAKFRTCTLSINQQICQTLNKF